MVYNFAFFAMAVALFFGGPTFWPDKRARLFGGYIAFLVSLAGAALVSWQALLGLALPSASAQPLKHDVSASAVYPAKLVRKTGNDTEPLRRRSVSHTGAHSVGCTHTQTAALLAQHQLHT
jgi:hypothetical protein